MTDIANVTELDFARIKQNLKDHFKQSNSPFKDWDFDGSGLNYLLDVLAYNTHYNAVNAHVSMNESFLDTAQIRGNVVSRAKLLSYIPRSNSGAKATIDISFTRAGGATETSLTLPRGTTFTSTIDNTDYTFTTLEDVTTSYENSRFTFNNVIIIEGELVTRSFIVNSNDLRQKYVIQDLGVDTSTLVVNVFANANSAEFDTYLESKNFNTYDSDTRVYFLSENFEGKYEIEFGDDVTGKKLDNLQLVEISYIATSEFPREANSINTFSYVSTNNAASNGIIDDVDTITVIDIAAGGDDRESIESIRKNAPLTFISQNRAVTTPDYEALIRSNISGLDALSVWGGQDANPPQYGKVFVAAKPANALFLTNAQKQEILDYLDTVKILTVKPEIVDPDFIYLFFDAFFQYDNRSTSLSKTQLESAVRSALEEYNTNVLGQFDKIFRYSNFLSIIDDTNAGILNSYARIYCYKNLNLVATSKLPATVDFKFELLGDTDQDESIISSTAWEFNGVDLYLKDEPISGSTERRVYAYRISNNIETKVFADVGRLNIETGKITLEALPTSFDTTIQVAAAPNSYDITTVREQLITIDFARSLIVGSKDSSGFSGSTASYQAPPIFRS